MKNNLKINKGYLTIALMVCVLIGFVLFVRFNASHRQSGEPQLETLLQDGLVGTWYSDRSADKTIAFTENGEYQASHYVASGTYQIIGTEVKLINHYREICTLEARLNVAGEVELCLDDEWLPVTFVKTAPLPPSSDQIPIPDDIHIMMLSSVSQILSAGEWALPTATLSFTRDTMTLTDTAGSIQHPFSLNDVTASANAYSASVTIDDTPYTLLITADETIVSGKTEYTLVLQGLGDATITASLVTHVDFTQP